MMPRPEQVLWATTFVCAALAIAEWRRAVPQSFSAPATALAAPRNIRYWNADSLALVAQGVVEKDPFRLERRPAAVRYDPAVESVVGTMPAPRAPRPMLTLSGVLGGPPWQAVIEGLPGRNGSTVVSAGDSLNDIRVTRVTRDSAIIQGKDTTWHLAVRRSW